MAALGAVVVAGASEEGSRTLKMRALGVLKLALAWLCRAG